MAKIAIIGTGWGARVQVPAFRKAGLDVVALAGRDATKTQETADRLGVSTATDDWTKLLDDGSIDLVSIVTPPSTHSEMALAALRAGKHVLCEKPTAMNADEALQMLREAESRPDQISLIDHELRFLPSWSSARARLPEIGPVRHAEVRYQSPSRASSDRPWNWWSDAGQGGGVLGAVGSHAIDALRHFLGELEAVQASLETFIRTRPFGDSQREVTSDDYASLHLRFSSGARASISLSVVASVDEPTTITLHAENGGLRLRESSLYHAEAGRNWVEQTSEKEPATGDSPGGAFGTATIHLAHALRRALDDGDRQALAPGATFRDGLMQQRALDAARASHRSNGSWVEVSAAV